MILRSLVPLLIFLFPSLSWSVSDATDTSPFPLRALYAPGHFGNSYEVLGKNEMRDLLSEAKRWGFNHYADWFDTIDCADPFADEHYNLAGALWDRKKTNFLTAQSLGLDTGLTITPNHVFLDQCLPDALAVKGGRIFGQLVCPSIPNGRKTILDNYERLFADLAKAGVRLSALWACPYDYGGCDCESCRPWILTFAKLTREIHEIAKRHHPDIEARFIGWWWSAEEHRHFCNWVDQEAPGWAKSMALHIPYGKTDVADVPLPKGCERQAFVHIGYADRASPRDIYGHTGPVIAADRIERTLTALEARGCTGFMAYSEGVYDDVNKALLAGIGAGNFSSADEVLKDYARRYFDAASETEEAWAAWLKPFGRPFEVDPSSASETLAEMKRETRETWRVRQWESKVDLLRAHASVMSATEWTTEHFERVDDFWSIQERLQREVWGLGPLRHALSRRFTPLPWYKDWVKAYHSTATD